MYFVVRTDGAFWDGDSWSQQGKPFLTSAAAIRSLCEEGEDIDEVKIMEANNDST